MPEPTAAPDEIESFAGCLASMDQVTWHRFNEVFWRRYYPVARGLSVNLGVEPADLLQGVLIKVYRNATNFDLKKGTLSGWLHVMLQSIATDIYRRKRAGKRPDMHVTEMDDDVRMYENMMDPTAITPEQKLLSDENKKKFQEAVLSLPESYRNVVNLRDLEERSVVETSEILGISQDNVKKRHQRGRVILKKKLQAYFGEKELAGDLL